jgi:hypothetical protein
VGKQLEDKIEVLNANDVENTDQDLAVPLLYHWINE